MDWPGSEIGSPQREADWLLPEPRHGPSDRLRNNAYQMELPLQRWVIPNYPYEVGMALLVKITKSAKKKGTSLEKTSDLQRRNTDVNKSHV